MSITIETLFDRVVVLEKQVAALIANPTDQLDAKTKPQKKEKKEKKEKKDKDSDDETSKNKRISGYILYSKANRDDVKTSLVDTDQPDVKPKNTDIMRKLAVNWKALTDEERGEWNVKAKEIKDA